MWYAEVCSLMGKYPQISSDYHHARTFSRKLMRRIRFIRIICSWIIFLNNQIWFMNRLYTWRKNIFDDWRLKFAFCQIFKYSPHLDITWIFWLLLYFGGLSNGATDFPHHSSKTDHLDRSFWWVVETMQTSLWWNSSSNEVALIFVLVNWTSFSWSSFSVKIYVDSLCWRRLEGRSGQAVCC